jgi:hypothetical protein
MAKSSDHSLQRPSFNEKLRRKLVRRPRFGQMRWPMKKDAGAWHESGRTKLQPPGTFELFDGKIWRSDYFSVNRTNAGSLFALAKLSKTYTVCTIRWLSEGREALTLPAGSRSVQP